MAAETGRAAVEEQLRMIDSESRDAQAFIHDVQQLRALRVENKTLQDKLNHLRLIVIIPDTHCDGRDSAG